MDPVDAVAMLAVQQCLFFGGPVARVLYARAHVVEPPVEQGRPTAQPDDVSTTA